MRIVLGFVVALTFSLTSGAAAQSPPKPGGVLKLMHREDLPQGFAIHETATNSVTWPAMPCDSNLVLFDQAKRVERRRPTSTKTSSSTPGARPSTA